MAHASPSLRYDGLYLCKIDDGDGTTEYLRFYPDGTVLEVLSTGTPDQTARWLYRGTDPHWCETITVDM